MQCYFWPCRLRFSVDTNRVKAPNERSYILPDITALSVGEGDENESKLYEVPRLVEHGEVEKLTQEHIISG